MGFSDEGMTVSSARIGFVKIPVDESVKAHANRSCADHAAENPPQLRGKQVAVGSGDHCAQGEGECENRVREANELTESLGEGWADRKFRGIHSLGRVALRVSVISTISGGHPKRSGNWVVPRPIEVKSAVLARR